MFLFQMPTHSSGSCQKQFLWKSQNSRCHILKTPRNIDRSFLGIYSPSTLLFEFIDLCIFINIRVLQSIFSNSVLFQSRNSAEWRSREIVQILIPLVIFPLFSFVSAIFLTLEMVSLKFFFHFGMLHSVGLLNTKILIVLSLLPKLYTLELSWSVGWDICQCEIPSRYPPLNTSTEEFSLLA